MEGVAALVIAGCAITCIAKGKQQLFVIGLVALIPFFVGAAPLGFLIGIPAIYGAMTRARPGSRWMESEDLSHPAPEKMPDDMTAKAPGSESVPVAVGDADVRVAGARAAIADFLSLATQADIIGPEKLRELQSLLERAYPTGARADSAVETPVAKPSTERPEAPDLASEQPTSPASPPPQTTRPKIPAKPESPSGSGPTWRPPAPPTKRPPEPTVRKPPMPPRPARPEPGPQPSTIPADEPALAASTSSVTSSEVAAWVRRGADTLWERVGPDLSVHGFSYLGLLLTFFGVFGFMFFAFADLPDAWQPFVEILIPLFFFGWGYFLLRRGAIVVAHLMGFLGGLLLPLVVYAGLVDSAPVPPDLTGGALIVGLTVVSLMISAVYAWWSSRQPTSWLRFLVAPMVWVAALGPGFIFKTDEPLFGEAITNLVSAQPAFAAAAITLTLVFFARRSDHRLAAPSYAAAIPAVPIAYVLTVTLTAGQGWEPVWPLVLAGAATVGSVDLLARRYGYEREAGLARPFVLALALAPLVPVVGPAWTGLLAVIAYLAMVEWEERRAGEWPAAALAGAGASVGLALSVTDPWVMVAAWATATVWAHVRRIGGLAADESEKVLTVAAAALPVGLAAAFVMALPDLLGLAVVGSLFAAVALVVRLTGADDPFWKYWLGAAGIVLSVVTASFYITRPTDSWSWAAPVAMLLAAVTLGAGTGWPTARVWVTSAVASGAFAIALDVASVANPAIWWAGAGLATVVAASVWSHPAAVHLAAVGHLVALGALFAGGSSGTRVAALAAWTLGWFVDLLADRFERPSMRGLIGLVDTEVVDGRIRRAMETLPTVILAASIPVSALELAGLWDRFAAHRTWFGVTLGALAVGYAAVSTYAKRWPVPPVFAAGAIILSLAGLIGTIPNRPSMIAAIVGTMVVAWLVARPRRWSLYVWFAWALSGALTVLLAGEAGIPDQQLHLVLLAWGVVLVIGGLAFDDVRSGRRSPGEGLRIVWLKYPVVVGALSIPIGLAPAYLLEPTVYGWWSLAAATGYAVIAVQLRAGAAAVPAYALAALGAAALSPWPVMERPIVLVPIAAALVAASWASERFLPRAVAAYLDWDWPPFAVGHVVGLVALVRATTTESVGTWIAVGVLSVVVGLWKRNRAWADVGNVLILVAAAGKRTRVDGARPCGHLRSRRAQRAHDQGRGALDLPRTRCAGRWHCVGGVGFVAGVVGAGGGVVYGVGVWLACGGCRWLGDGSEPVG